MSWAFTFCSWLVAKHILAVIESQGCVKIIVSLRRWGWCSDCIRSCDSLPLSISSLRSRGPPHRSRREKWGLIRWRLVRKYENLLARGLKLRTGRRFHQIPLKPPQQIKNKMIAAAVGRWRRAGLNHIEQTQSLTMEIHQRRPKNWKLFEIIELF